MSTNAKLGETVEEWTAMSTEMSAIFRASDEHDEVRYAAFVDRNVKSIMRLRDKANAKGKSAMLWFGFTDEDCTQAAIDYCRMYRHQFRVFRRVLTEAA